VADFETAVRAVLRGLGAGEVMTYGEIAEEAGHPGAARAVGNLLRDSEGLAWWRVVAAGGRLAPGKEAEQAARLRAEGVTVVDGRVRRPAPPAPPPRAPATPRRPTGRRGGR
jgi:methylated-DNA-protein-cysteine methyltransferase related protein